jgi:hypothetical protein
MWGFTKGRHGRLFTLRKPKSVHGNDGHSDIRDGRRGIGVLLYGQMSVMCTLEMIEALSG